MNPLTNMKNVTKLSEQELYSSNKTSWHDQYTGSAWIFIGGLPYDLTEGDIICIFSQYGEIVNINLIRDKDTGKSKGFCFICYEDQRSTVLAVDNFNGIKILNRILRVDHVSDYKVPKQGKKTDVETKKLYEEGCAPKTEIPKFLNPLIEPLDVRETLADQIHADIKLPARLPIYPIKTEPLDEDSIKTEEKKEKINEKKEKRRRKSKRQNSSYDSKSDSENDAGKTRKRSKSSPNGESDAEEDQRKKSKKQKKTRQRYDIDPEPSKQRSRTFAEYGKKYDAKNEYQPDHMQKKIKMKSKKQERSRSRSLDRIYNSKKHVKSADHRR